MQVVVAPAEDHWPTMASLAYDGSLTGEHRAPSSSTRPLPFSPKRIMAHRAMLELTKPHSIVNLGIGAPEVAIIYPLTSASTCPCSFFPPSPLAV